MKLIQALYVAVAAVGVLALANCSSGSGSSNNGTCYTNGYGQTYQSGSMVPTTNCGGGTYTQQGNYCYNSSMQPVATSYCGGSANGYGGGYYGGTGYGGGYGYGSSTGYCTTPYGGYQAYTCSYGQLYCTAAGQGVCQ